jgi:hypothetical protein
MKVILAALLVIGIVLAIGYLTFLIGGYLIDAVGPRPLYLVAGLIVVACGVSLLSSRVVRGARLTPQANTLDNQAIPVQE